MLNGLPEARMSLKLHWTSPKHLQLRYMIHVMAMPMVQVKQFIYSKIQPTAIIPDTFMLTSTNMLIGLKRELFNMLEQSMQFDILSFMLKKKINVWT